MLASNGKKPRDRVFIGLELKSGTSLNLLVHTKAGPIICEYNQLFKLY